MVPERNLEQINYEFETDREHAQILIEVDNSLKSFDEVKKIIERPGVSISETRQLAPNRILIKLNIKDMRDVILKLTESGFLNIKGVNASL